MKQICQICGDEMKGRNDKKYCSPTCRTIAWGKKRFDKINKGVGNGTEQNKEKVCI